MSEKDKALTYRKASLEDGGSIEALPRDYISHGHIRSVTQHANVAKELQELTERRDKLTAGNKNSKVPEELESLIEKKSNELQALTSKIEAMIYRYVKSWTIEDVITGDLIPQPSPENDPFDYMTEDQFYEVINVLFNDEDDVSP